MNYLHNCTAATIYIAKHMKKLYTIYDTIIIFYVYNNYYMIATYVRMCLYTSLMYCCMMHRYVPILMLIKHILRNDICNHNESTKVQYSP